MSAEYTAGSIRDFYVLGQFIGKRIVDITESDPDEASRFVMLMFEDGSAVVFPTTDDGMHLINVEVPDA